jgi:hypothetical protein
VGVRDLFADGAVGGIGVRRRLGGKYWFVTIRRGVAAVVAAGVLVVGGACSGRDGDDGDSSSVTVPEDTAVEASTTTTAGSVDAAFAVPATIDDAYVNRVLAELDRVQGDVFRRIVANGSFAQADLVPLRAVFNDPELTGQAQGFATLVGSIDRARKPPGDNKTTVVRLLTARPDCIYAETTVDVSATVLDPPPPRTQWVALRPSQPDTDPQGLNPTPFSIAAEHTAETNPCG